jgi:hypothetical protein
MPKKARILNAFRHLTMHPKTIFSKTPKGVLEVKNKTAKLPRDVGLVFLSVDGKSTAADLARKSGLNEKALDAALQKLIADGFIRVFSSPDSPQAPQGVGPAAIAAAVPVSGGGADDLDFTSPAAMAKLNAEATNRARAETDAKARALAAARAAAEAKVRQEAGARARVLAEAKAKSEAEARIKAEAAAKAAAEARAKAEGEAKAAAGSQARGEAEARVRAAMEAKTRAEAEARARAESEERAKAEVEVKGAAEAKAKEEAEARARAEIEARAHADAETRAKAAVEAQVKALTEALAEAQQRAKQETDARARVESEIKARQEAERRAREEAEARAKAAEDAVEQARSMAEEAARAKAAAESRAAIESVGGNEVARAHMESAMKALEEAKAKARAEAVARTDAERRAKAEADARMREERERRARDEKERRERDDAEARTRAQLRELQEQARRATLEAEARAETERKGREEAEAKVEDERQARKEAERKAAAEARTREESLAKIRAEAEAKARTEVEAMIRAERQARAEAERKAQLEIAARIEAERRARAEAERQAEIARQAREEAERKARELATGGDSQAALRARAEAEIIARKAEEAVAQARAQADVERKARAEAEDRAKVETVARVMQEQQLRAGAEDEIKARVHEEIKARERAEVDAEARYRREAAARAKAAAEERRKREAEAQATGKAVRIRKATNWPRTFGVSLAVLLAIAVGLLHVVPLNNYIGGVQEIASKRLGVPVTISTLRYALLPSPQLTLERIGIGKLQEIKIESIVVSAWPHELFGENKEFDNVEVNVLSADQDALALVQGWVQPQPGVSPLVVRRVQLRGVRLAVKEIDVPLFSVDVALDPDGTLQRATLSDGKANITVAPTDRGLRVGLEARSWRLPIGPAVEFDEVSMEATLGTRQASITSIDGKIGRGTVKGSARASWAEGNIRVDGDFSLVNGEVAYLLSEFTRDLTATGTLNANVTYALRGTRLQNLFAQPTVEATFNIEKGVLNNVDIVRAIQSPARDGARGGKTGFNTLAGSMRLANQSYSYRQLQLSSGPMNASGNVEIASNGDLSGRVSAQLGSKTVVVARGNLTVTGNLKTPVLR